MNPRRVAEFEELKRRYQADREARTLLPQKNHIGISGGKDSTALLLWAVHESGYDHDTLDVTFCDTGNEAPQTYEYIQMLSERVFPVKTITPEMGFYDLVIRKRIFPSARRRFCTELLKLVPTRDYAFELEARGFAVVLHSGVRAGESAERAKLEERGLNSYTGLPERRPLLRWSIDDVWAMHAKYGIPRNPLYDLGMRRVGCFPCCMSGKKELRAIKKNFPERVVFLAEQERLVNEALDNPATYRTFFHAATVPASQRTKVIKDKNGEEIRIATVADVFRWAETARGGQQYDWDFVGDEPHSCMSGMCE